MDLTNFNMDTIMESVLDDIDEMIFSKKIEPRLPDTSGTTNHSPYPSYHHHNTTPTNRYHIAVHPIDTSYTYDPSLTSTVYTNESNDTPLSHTPHNINISPVHSLSNNSSHLSTIQSTSTHNADITDSKYNTNRVSKHSNKNITVFETVIDAKLQLKHVVFISRDSSQKLADYIVTENWGKTCSLLYKYLDYIFRCQLFAKQTILISDPYKPNMAKYLIFNTGLQRKSDNEVLYAFFTPNNIVNAQQWRVPFGHIRHSFLSKQELLNKLHKNNIKMSVSEVPQRTKFYSSLNEILYDSNYSITANWEERLTTNKDRILNVIGNAAFFDDNCKFLKLTELIECFLAALPKTRNIAELNPRLAVPQAFVDTKHGKYRLELLLPIIVQFPKRNGNSYKFVLAIGKSEHLSKTYVIKSLLTMEMAYANARLVGYVDSLWLHYGHNKKTKNNINDFCVNP